MKELKRLLYLFSLVLVIAACGGDGDGDGGGNDGGNGNVNKNNVNRNIVINEKAVGRLEFPRLKGGNSKVLVYRVTDNSSYDKDRVNYCVEWDCDKKSQRWSCYQLHKGYGGGYSRVIEGYLFDTNLKAGEYWDRDYFYGSGFDHGHICPNADRMYSYSANYQTFYLTNMQPQYRKFNGYSNKGDDQGEGLWYRLENKVRTYTPHSASDTLYVCKGGTIDREDYIISRIQGKQIVPRYFFMACLKKQGSEYAAVGFWMEQKNEWATNANLGDYAVTIDKLEELTGIDFFCNLPDDIENKVERSFGRNFWGLQN